MTISSSITRIEAPEDEIEAKTRYGVLDIWKVWNFDPKVRNFEKSVLDIWKAPNFVNRNEE